MIARLYFKLCGLLRIFELLRPHAFLFHIYFSKLQSNLPGNKRGLSFQSKSYYVTIFFEILRLYRIWCTYKWFEHTFLSIIHLHDHHLFSILYWFTVFFNIFFSSWSHRVLYREFQLQTYDDRSKHARDKSVRHRRQGQGTRGSTRARFELV